MAALEAIQATLGLDYAGLDFGIGPNGELLVFEANAVMNIIPPDASPQWDYRRPAIDRAIAAARRLLVNRARRSP
jgi:glutathione synthase/RimK-type ligase-like ATP-grasp enzyme